MAGPSGGRPSIGLSGRIALLASGLVVAALAVIGVLADRLLAERAHAEMRGRSFALLESLAVSCAFDVADGAIERLDDALTELTRKGREQLDVESVAFLDADATALAHSGSGTFEEAIAQQGFEDLPRVMTFASEASAAETPRWLYAARRDLDDALVLSMPVVSGLRWGTLVAVFDTGRVSERIVVARAIVIGAAVAVALVLVLALQAGLLVLVVRPLRRLRAAVKQLESGDFGARAEVRARNEIGQLAGAFNAMAGELESYTRTLEARVAQRTAEAERRREELEALNAQLAVLARTDGLTGVANRRHVLEQLEVELGRARRHGHAIAIAMADIDHFKQVNDTWGHDAGDAVIQNVARLLAARVRGHDLVGRYGGEEFILVLLEPLPHETVAVFERLREAVEELVTRLPDGREIKVTMSFGVAVVPAAAPERGPASERAAAGTGAGAGGLDALLVAADRALYEAKRAGRDRVVEAALSESRQA